MGWMVISVEPACVEDTSSSPREAGRCRLLSPDCLALEKQKSLNSPELESAAAVSIGRLLLIRQETEGEWDHADRSTRQGLSAASADVHLHSTYHKPSRMLVAWMYEMALLGPCPFENRFTLRHAKVDSRRFDCRSSFRDREAGLRSCFKESPPPRCDISFLDTHDGHPGHLNSISYIFTLQACASHNRKLQDAICSATTGNSR